MIKYGRFKKAGGRAGIAGCLPARVAQVERRARYAALEARIPPAEETREYTPVIRAPAELKVSAASKGVSQNNFNFSGT